MSSTAGVWIGQRMILAGVGLIVVGALFERDVISATQLTIGWSAIFVFASAGASSAYLTEVWLGVDAEQRQLEDVAQPLTADS